MSYTVEKMAGEPVILIRLNEDYDAAAEMMGTIQASMALVTQQTEPVFSIWDVRHANVNLEGLMAGTNVARFQAIAPPNQLGSIVVGNASYLKPAMQGLDSDAYGHMMIHVRANMDDALALVHELISKRASA